MIRNWNWRRAPTGRSSNAVNRLARDIDRGAVEAGKPREHPLEGEIEVDLGVRRVLVAGVGDRDGERDEVAFQDGGGIGGHRGLREVRLRVEVSDGDDEEGQGRRPAASRVGHDEAHLSIPARRAPAAVEIRHPGPSAEPDIPG